MFPCQQQGPSDHPFPNKNKRPQLFLYCLHCLLYPIGNCITGPEQVLPITELNVKLHRQCVSQLKGGKLALAMQLLHRYYKHRIILDHLCMHKAFKAEGMCVQAACVFVWLHVYCAF